MRETQTKDRKLHGEKIIGFVAIHVMKGTETERDREKQRETERERETDRQREREIHHLLRHIHTPNIQIYQYAYRQTLTRLQKINDRGTEWVITGQRDSQPQGVSVIQTVSGRMQHHDPFSYVRRVYIHQGLLLLLLHLLMQLTELLQQQKGRRRRSIEQENPVDEAEGDEWRL